MRLDYIGLLPLFFLGNPSSPCVEMVSLTEPHNRAHETLAPGPLHPHLGSWEATQQARGPNQRRLMRL